MSKKALNKVKVIEVGHMVAAPYSAKLMADMGAEVIKIEEPVKGDPARYREPFAGNVPNPESSGLFLYLNANKLGITLNLEETSGQNLFKDLIKSADILIEDFLPGRMAELGLDYDTLSQINPKIIMVSITPYGQTGPYSKYKSYHLNTFHASWEGYLTPGGNTFPERPPINQGRFVGEYESGIIATIPILAALRWQRKTGKGQYIDCSQQEMLMQLDAAELVRYPNEGLAATRGTRGYNVGGVMPCKDGYLEFTMLEEHQWQALVRLMDHPEWANDPKFKERASRETHGKELNDLVKKWLADYTKEDTYHLGQAEGCTVAPYNTVDEVLRSNQMKARSFFVEIEHAQTGQFKYATAPYKYSATPLAIVRPAPTLGEHNEEIYCQRLGCSQQDIIKLRETGAI